MYGRRGGFREEAMGRGPLPSPKNCTLLKIKITRKNILYRHDVEMCRVRGTYYLYAMKYK